MANWVRVRLSKRHCKVGHSQGPGRQFVIRARGLKMFEVCCRNCTHGEEYQPDVVLLWHAG